MIIIILVVLILMNGVGFWSAPATPGTGFRYGYGGLGFLLLVLLVLGVLNIIPLR
jgi:hypothetical protein